MLVNFRNIVAGTSYMVGYGGNLDRCTFLGFTDRSEKYSEKPVHRNAEVMLEIEGCRSFTELEQKDRTYEHGFGIYAVFKDEANGDVFRAYLYQGKWCLGTSADRCQIEAV